MNKTKEEKPTTEKRQLKMTRKFIGVVVSDKMKGTVVVRMIIKRQHPLYRKIVAKIKKFYADNRKDARIGDIVEIQETRPISRLKRFTVLRVVTASKRIRRSEAVLKK